MRIGPLALFALAATHLAPQPVAAQLPSPDPGLQCRAAIRAAERAHGIPDHLMAAIGRAESGRPDARGQVNPWPWSINAEGAGYVFETKQAAVAAVRALQAKGVRSIDVGCMQVNLMHHPTAFGSLEDAFDPASNARYAARFLLELKAQTGSWTQATAHYHSATPELGEPYQRRVMALWPEEKRRGGEDRRAELAAAWAATLPAGRGGGFMLSNRSEAARVLPGSSTGRGLEAYRSAPIPLAARPSGRTQL